METWKNLPGYPGYSVSSLGSLRNDKTGTVLKARLVKNYKQVGIYLGGKKKEVKLHRAVATAFLGPPPTPKHHAAHNDGNPHNNCVENIRWATITENNRDKQKHGTQTCGTAQHLAKLNDELVRSIRAKRAAGETLSQLVAQFGVRKYTIQLICQNRTWKHVQ